MAKIIAVAENYAFGPISKLITVCEELGRRGHKITFLGDGTAYQLGRKANFSSSFRIDTDGKDFEEKASEIIKGADFLISSVDRSSILLAKKLGVRTILIDMLFYWWDVIPEYWLDVDLYLRQSSLKDERNMEIYESRIKNLVSVGPIIDLKYKGLPKRNQLLIAYGGTEAHGWYKIGKDSNYPYTIADIVLNRINTSKYDNIIFAGNERIMADMNGKYGSDRVSFKMLPHDQWLQELAISKDVLINPGLEAPLEAIAYNCPVFFLPPYNSSAYLELDEFRKIGLASRTNSINFDDYFPKRDFYGRNLREIMVEFLADLKTYENSPDILDDTAKRIQYYLDLSPEEKVGQVGPQKAYLEKMGENGLLAATEEIDSFIRKSQALS